MKNLHLSVTREKNKNAFLGPSSPEIPVDLTIGLKSDPLGKKAGVNRKALCLLGVFVIFLRRYIFTGTIW